MRKETENTILIEHLKNYIYLQGTYDIRFNHHLCRERSRKEWEQLDAEIKNRIYNIFEYAVLNAYRAFCMLDKTFIPCKFIKICFSEEEETKCYTRINNYYIFNYCLKDVFLLYEHRLKTKEIPIMAYLGNDKYRYVVLRGIKLLNKEGYVVEDSKCELAGVGKTRKEAEEDLIKKRVMKFAESLI